MPPTNSLKTLLEAPQNNALPGILVYCEKPGPRLYYTFDFIFKRVLKCHYQLTDNETEYKTHEGVRINYSNREFPGYKIVPDGLLNETHLRSGHPEAIHKNGQIYFFGAPDSVTDLHFDVFAAVFYFISRYEEWQEYRADVHGRFEAGASLLYKHDAHLKPVVDQWIWEFASALKKQQPELEAGKPMFEYLSTIDIDNLYAYKAKSFLRVCGASARDLIKFNIKHFFERFQVLSGLKKDPFDIYDDIPAFAREQNYELLFFFLYRNGTPNDRTVKPGSLAFKEVFERLRAQGANIGLHPSYDSAFEETLLTREYELICNTAGHKINFTRNHFLRYNIRRTPHALMQLGVKADFTMGFASQPGFRAGTAHPFHYFDLVKNEAHHLLFVPFCAMDGAFINYNKTAPERIMKTLTDLAAEVKKTGGFYVTVFHESTISNHLYKGFGTLYKNLHLHLKQLRGAEI